mmetsp:Transcript_40131/g.79360  ORF Transcript_40131/g.79360 Transcript_40131/m.79360 type:complete len:98 (-) Transcript_40131:221-514(-)
MLKNVTAILLITLAVRDTVSGQLKKTKKNRMQTPCNSWPNRPNQPPSHGIWLLNRPAYFFREDHMCAKGKKNTAAIAPVACVVEMNFEMLQKTGGLG